MPKKYKPMNVGLTELGMSSWMKGVTAEAGREMEAMANKSGHSTYESESRVVRAGWANEPRYGAVVREIDRDWRDSRDRTLLTVAESMRIRGGR